MTLIARRRSVTAALVLAGVCLTASTRAPAPVAAFVNVSVVPMDRERVLHGYTVIVRGDRITALGPAGQVAVPDEALQIDGTGKYLMPGLSDMHVHFAGTGPGGWILNPQVDAEAMLFTFVANGVTTVRDMHSGSGGGDAWMPALRRRISTGELLGPRIYAAGDPDHSSPEAAARSVVALKSAGYEYVKYYGNQRLIYDSIIAAARRVALPFVAHGLYAEEGGLALVFNDRWASVEHLTGYLEYAKGFSGWWGARDSLEARRAKLDRSVDDTTLQRIAQETRHAGVWNCPTLAWTQYLIGEVYGRARQTPVAMEFFPRMVKALQHEGAGLILGTDAQFTDGTLLWSGFAIHRELESLVAAGLTPYQALTTGTRNVARFLGTENSTGTVTLGKRADLVLLKGNPLVDIRQTAALAGVMVGGRWLSRAELDATVDTMGALVRPDVTSHADTTWGTVRVQMRLLARALWR